MGAPKQTTVNLTERAQKIKEKYCPDGKGLRFFLSVALIHLEDTLEENDIAFKMYSIRIEEGKKKQDLVLAESLHGEKSKHEVQQKQKKGGKPSKVL